MSSKFVNIRGYPLYLNMVETSRHHQEAVTAVKPVGTMCL